MSLDAEDLLSFSYQVAKGMEYITSKNVRPINIYGAFKGRILSHLLRLINHITDKAPDDGHLPVGSPLIVRF